MRSNITERQGALIDTETGFRVTFDFNPDTIEDSKSTNLTEVNIPGMSHPRLQFANGGSRTLNFTIYLHYGATDDVEIAIRNLLSWLYPEYEGEKLKKAPAKLLLVFGDTFPDEQWILRSCNIARQRFDKYLNCILAKADIELVEFIEQSRDASEFRDDIDYYEDDTPADFDYSTTDDYNGVGYFDE